MEPIRRGDSDDLFEAVVSQDSVMRWLATGRGVIVKSCGWWLGWCGRRPVSVPRLQEFLDPGNGVLGACVHVTGHAE